MIPFRDMIAMLHFARTMSSFGPDFEDQLTQKAWHNKLKGIPLDDLKKSLNELTGDRNFPMPNEIVDFCKGISQVAEMLPEVAFDLLWRKIGSVGQYADPEFPNEIGLAVERLGGWKYICNEWLDDKRPWHEKAFNEVYQNIQQAKAQHALPVSRYSPEALNGDQPKQISAPMNEALRMAMSGPDEPKPKLTNRLRDIKNLTNELP